PDLQSVHLFFFFFFFSSRRRHTRFSRDWSSDVCSSDLPPRRALRERSPYPPPARERAPGRSPAAKGGNPSARLAARGPARRSSHQRITAGVRGPEASPMVRPPGRRKPPCRFPRRFTLERATGSRVGERVLG